MSPTQLALFYERGVLAISGAALDKLQRFRNVLGVPLVVNHGSSRLRGSRSIIEAVNLFEDFCQDPNSWTFHLYCGFDVSCEDRSAKWLFDRAKDFGEFHGIGLYPTWVHLDDRTSLDDEITTWGDDTPSASL